MAGYCEGFVIYEIYRVSPFMEEIPSLFTPYIAVGEYHTPSHTSRPVSESESIGSAVELGSIQHLDHGTSAGNDDQRIGHAEFQTDDRSVDIGQATPSLRIELCLLHQMFHVEYISHDWQAARSSKFMITFIIISRVFARGKQLMLNLMLNCFDTLNETIIGSLLSLFHLIWYIFYFYFQLYYFVHIIQALID